MSMSEFHLRSTANDNLADTAMRPCVECRTPFWSKRAGMTRCGICRNNLRAHLKWAQFMRGRSAPDLHLHPREPEMAVPVTEPRASFGMVDNLVVAIGLTLVCCIVITLFG